MGSKSFWKVTKYLTKQASSIPILKDCDSNEIHDDEEKATLLNEFFSRCSNSAFENLDQPSPAWMNVLSNTSEEEVLEMLSAVTGHLEIKWSRWYFCYHVKGNRY